MDSCVGKSSGRKKHGRRSRRRCSRRRDFETDGTLSSYSTSTQEESDDDPPADRKKSDRILGPAVTGLTEIVPADERFAYRVTYRRYRLLNTNSRQGHSVSKNLGLQSRRFVKLYQNRLFNDSKPLDVIEFLSAFKKRCDQNGVSEGMAVELMTYILQDLSLIHI